MSSGMARRFIPISGKLKKKTSPSSAGGLTITVPVDVKFYETPQKFIQENTRYLIRAADLHPCSGYGCHLEEQSVSSSPKRSHGSLTSQSYSCFLDVYEVLDLYNCFL